MGLNTCAIISIIWLNRNNYVVPGYFIAVYFSDLMPWGDAFLAGEGVGMGRETVTDKKKHH